jgi:hypothetical protein
MRGNLIGYAFLIIVGCSSQGDRRPLVRGPLADLYLRVDPRYDGLVNQTCAEFSGDKCSKWDVLEYKLSDSEINSILVKLKFVCKINGERFGICGNGFCQKTYREKSFVGITYSRKQYILNAYDMVKDKRFLVEARTYCISQPNEGMLED